MNISEHFDIREFVCPEIWNTFGENSRWFVDERVIKLAEFYRNYWQKHLIINNWHTGGQFHYRGFRMPDCKEGASLSQHKFKGAFDCNVVGITPEQMYRDILANERIFMAQGLTTLEDITITTGWLHSDTRNTGLDHLLIVKP